jgi:hypothetical protein
VEARICRVRKIKQRSEPSSKQEEEWKQTCDVFLVSMITQCLVAKRPGGKGGIKASKGTAKGCHLFVIPSDRKPIGTTSVDDVIVSGVGRIIMPNRD